MGFQPPVPSRADPQLETIAGWTKQRCTIEAPECGGVAASGKQEHSMAEARRRLMVLAEPRNWPTLKARALARTAGSKALSGTHPVAETTAGTNRQTKCCGAECCAEWGRQARARGIRGFPMRYASCSRRES